MSAPETPPLVYGPRPYTISGHDHSGIALTISVLFLVYAVMVVSMRIATKYRNMGVDDWITVGATVCPKNDTCIEMQLTIYRALQ